MTEIKLLKSIETFKYINANWKDEYFMDCIDKWNEIKSCISEDGIFMCSSCGTKWIDKKYIFEEICPKCDNQIQPFLSNPINFRHVIDYINTKHWKYIFPIYSFFQKLDEKKDIINYCKFYNIPSDVLIAYKEHGEYGTSINLFNLTIDKYMRFFQNREGPYAITQLTFGKDHIGLREIIYSNRTEYYFGSYFSIGIDPKIEKVLKYINEHFEYFYPELQQFINSIDEFMLIDAPNIKSDFFASITCNKCGTIDLPDYNICYFCNNKYCDSCMPDEISFEKCDTCGITICYYDGKYTDYKCLKTQFRSGDCGDCGN